MKNNLLITLSFVTSLISAQVPILNSNPQISNKVIYLDFDGQKVSGTAWNSGNTINAAASTLNNASKIAVWKRVSEDYRPFDVNVTTDSMRFKNANPVKRIRVVITPTSSWYPSAGGVAYVGSFTWGGTPGTPCWVFENALGYNAKSVAEAASHEVGHTLTLKHHSIYDANCNKTQEYNPGFGSGVTSWAPIMGVGYNDNVTIWHFGKNATSCNTIQYDLASGGLGVTSNGFLSFLPDDVGNTYTTAKPLNLNTVNLVDSGIITQPGDIDAYRFTICSNRYVSFSVKPFCLDTSSYTGANLDIKFFLYDNANNLLLVDTSLNRLHTLAGTNLTPGSYYFTIDGGRSNYYNDYGSLGKYYISVKATNPPAMTSTISANSSICSGQSAVLTASSSAVPNSWLWTVTGATTSTYSVASPTVLFGSSGLYTVTLLATNNTATSCPVMQLLNVQPAPVVNVTGNEAMVCPGKSVTLNASGATAYTWNPGNTTGASRIVTPSVTTTFTVTGSNGSCNSPVVVTLTVSPPFNVSLATSGSVVCEGDTVSIFASGANSYTFFPGGSTQNPIYLSPANNTTVIVSGSIGNCVMTASTALKFVPDFTVEISASDYFFCLGDTFLLTANGANNYTFNPGGITTNPATMIFNGPTVYTVTGVTDPNCPKEETVVISSASCNYAGLDEAVQSNISVYPNPASDAIYIRSDSPIESVSVVNGVGKLIYSSSGSANPVNTSQWPAGIYFLTVKGGSGVYTTKIVVQ
jgi:hypothetical protein